MKELIKKERTKDGTWAIWYRIGSLVVIEFVAANAFVI